MLGLPIDCRLGVDCSIQNFVDHDQGPGWRDYACGTLSYDGHGGTDFRVADERAMNAGVKVVASAAGTVIATRDSEPDVSVRQRGRIALAGKEAGNSVRISHGDGWETQYSHLKRGSVAVRVGQRVSAGAVLGQLGLSGHTEFPHVEFTVRHHGRTIDPFAPEAQACGGSEQTLWDPALAMVLKYRPSGLLAAGFAAEPAKRERAEAGDYVGNALAADAPAIVFWLALFGLKQGDILEMDLVGPDGRALASGRSRAERHQAVWFAVIGKRRRDLVWPVGEYVGRAVLRRGERVVIDEARTLTVH